MLESLYGSYRIWVFGYFQSSFQGKKEKEVHNEELVIYAVQDTLLGQTVPSSFK